MHIAWDMKMNSVQSLNYVDFTREEKDWWINQAILAFVSERFSGYKGLGFEESQKRIEDLRILVEDAVISPSGVGSKPNSKVFNLPDNYWIADEEEVGIGVTGTAEGNVSKRVGITECAGDQYRFHIDNPFSAHLLDAGKAKPLRTFIKSQVEIVGDGNYSVDSYYLRYLRKPAQVNSLSSPQISCDLNEFNHNDVIEMATRMAVASLGDGNKYQIKTIEETKNLN